MQENISGIRVVKGFVREDHENQKFVNASGNLYKMFVTAEKIISWNNPVMMFVIYACILLISWFGAQFIVGGSMTTGELTSLFSYIMSALMALMMLSMIFVMVTMSVASARRISEVLNEKSDITNPADPVMEIKDGSIDFDHVNFAYKHKSNQLKEKKSSESSAAPAAANPPSQALSAVCTTWTAAQSWSAELTSVNTTSKCCATRLP